MTSCFFCQNLLSDYVEGVLPSARQQEVSQHMEKCPSCKSAERDLSASLKVLRSLPLSPLSNETALRITEASDAGRSRRWNRTSVSKAVFWVTAPCLIMLWLGVAFPATFPWLSWLKAHKEEAQLVRYYPLQQGAAEILEEQGAWLHDREPLMGSLWEEGGLSPEEFEKIFQIKGSKGEEK